MRRASQVAGTTQTLNVPSWRHLHAKLSLPGFRYGAGPDREGSRVRIRDVLGSTEGTCITHEHSSRDTYYENVILYYLLCDVNIESLLSI